MMDAPIQWEGAVDKYPRSRYALKRAWHRFCVIRLTRMLNQQSRQVMIWNEAFEISGSNVHHASYISAQLELARLTEEMEYHLCSAGVK